MSAKDLEWLQNYEVTNNLDLKGVVVDDEVQYYVVVPAE